MDISIFTFELLVALCYSHIFSRRVAYGHGSDVSIILIQDVFSMTICPFQTHFTSFYVKLGLYYFCGINSGV